MPPLGLKVRAWENFGCRQLPASYQGSSLARLGVAFTEVWSGPVLLPQSQACSPRAPRELSTFLYSFSSSLWVSTSEDQWGLQARATSKRREGSWWGCDRIWLELYVVPNAVRPLMGFAGGSEIKASACNAGDRDSIPGLGRSPGEENCNPLHYCLENLMDEGAWYSTVHRVAKSRTQLSDFTFTFFNAVRRMGGTNNARPALHQALGGSQWGQGQILWLWNIIKQLAISSFWVM